MGGKIRYFGSDPTVSENNAGGQLEIEKGNVPTGDKLKDQGFAINKKFVLKKPHIYIDNEHKKWAIAADEKADPQIYNFADILDCEIWENSVKKCNSLKVNIIVNNAEHPLMYINLINFSTPKNSIIYKKEIGYAEDIVLTFIYMKNQPKSILQAANERIPFEIKQLADLEDQGILTEEEFSKKKTELLAKMV